MKNGGGAPLTFDVEASKQAREEMKTNQSILMAMLDGSVCGDESVCECDRTIWIIYIYVRQGREGVMLYCKVVRYVCMHLV